MGSDGSGSGVFSGQPPGAVRAPLFRSKLDVLAALEQRLLAGEFPVGSRLPSERVLCDEYSISRPVIREVLSGLVERGYIEVYAGRGSFVRAAEASDISRPLNRAARRGAATARDLVTARSMLESTAAELAAQNADEAAIGRIREALAGHELANGVQSAAETDLQFHEAIAQASGNPLLVVMFASIREFVHALMLRSHSDRQVRNAGDPLHQVILEAIVNRDSVAARRSMAEHLRLALDFYGGDLDIPLVNVLENRGLNLPALRAADSVARPAPR